MHTAWTIQTKCIPLRQAMMICCDVDAMAKSFGNKNILSYLTLLYSNVSCIPIAIIIQSCRASKKNTEEFLFHTIRIYLGKTENFFTPRAFFHFFLFFLLWNTSFIHFSNAFHCTYLPIAFAHLTFHICRFIIWLCLSFHRLMSFSHNYPHFYAKCKISWLSFPFGYGCHNQCLLAVKFVSHP